MSDPKKALGEALSIPKIRLDQAVRNSEIKARKMSYGKDSKQYLLYFDPVGSIKRRVIVYIHGGGWMTGSPNRYRHIGRTFADMGYHTISLGYRLAPIYKYPAQAEDIFAAYSKGLQFLMKKKVPVDQVVVVGSSAGGHLGGILVYDTNMQKKFDVDASAFKGLVSLGGVMSFDADFPQTTQMMIDSLFEKKYDRKQAEPISMVRASHKTRVLCIHAQNDPISEVDNQKQFVDRVNMLNKDFAQSMIIRDENVFHSNLVVGVFLQDPEESNPLKVLFRWIESLPV